MDINRLTPDQREEFHRLRRLHPNWSDEQIMKKISLDVSISNAVDKYGEDVDENDPEILSEILQGAKHFLLALGIIVVGFFEVIDSILDTLGDMIASGITYIGNKLSEFWDWLNS